MAVPTLELTLTLDKASSKQSSIFYSQAMGLQRQARILRPSVIRRLPFSQGRPRKKLTSAIVADDIKEAREFLCKIENPVNAVLVKVSSNITLTNE